MRLEIKETVFQIIRDLRNNFNEIDNLPSGLVHMDYDSDNILINKNKITAILDFDDLSYQPFIVDLGWSLWWWLFLNKNKSLKLLYKKYLQKYQKNRKLSQKELKFLPLFIKMRNVSVAIFDVNNSEIKSEKEWRKVLNFNKAIDSLA